MSRRTVSSLVAIAMLAGLYACSQPGYGSRGKVGLVIITGHQGENCNIVLQASNGESGGTASVADNADFCRAVPQADYTAAASQADGPGELSIVYKIRWRLEQRTPRKGGVTCDLVWSRHDRPSATESTSGPCRLHKSKETYVSEGRATHRVVASDWPAS